MRELQNRRQRSSCSCFISHTDIWTARHPGLPCPLSSVKWIFNIFWINHHCYDVFTVPLAAQTGNGPPFWPSQPQGTIASLSPVTVAGLVMTNCSARGRGQGSSPPLVMLLNPQLHNLSALSGTVCPASYIGCVHVCGRVWFLQEHSVPSHAGQQLLPADMELLKRLSSLSSSFIELCSMCFNCRIIMLFRDGLSTLQDVLGKSQRSGYSEYLKYRQTTTLPFKNSIHKMLRLKKTNFLK